MPETTIPPKKKTTTVPAKEKPKKLPGKIIPTDLHSPKLVLQALGIHSLHSLDRFGPYRDARLLIASGKNNVSLPELSSIVTVEYYKRPVANAAAWPIHSLKGLASVHVSALESTGIRTISDLAGLGSYVDQVLASGKEDNGFYEPPSAPSELLPNITGSISTSNRYASFVRDTDLRGLRLGLDTDCIEVLPLADKYSADQITSLLQGIEESVDPEVDVDATVLYDSLKIISGRIPDNGPRYHLGEIFTKLKCPVFYLGYMIEHQQDWINLGTYLGDVKSSICLAPGESRQIAFLDWTRRQNLNRQEDTDKEDQLTVDAVHSRALQEVTQAVAIEHQMGGSETEASTSTMALSAVGSAALAGGLGTGLAGAGIGAGIGTLIEPGGGTAIGAGIGGLLGGSIGAAAGAVYSSSQLLGTIHAASEGDRDVSAELNQRITQRTQQNSGLKQSLFSTVVLDDSQDEQVQANTRNITNYNHMHSLNVLYYEVLQHYLARTHVTKIEPLLYLPYRFMEFTGFNFIRDYWDVIREYMKKDLQSLGDTFFVDEDGPTAPDLLTVPPFRNPPQAPEAPESSRIKDLEIDLVYDAKIDVVVGEVSVGVDLGLSVKRGNQIHRGSRKVNGNRASGRGFGTYNKYEFAGINSAEDITHVVIAKSQVTSSDLDFKIEVMKGEIIHGNGTSEDIPGSNIVSNTKIDAADGNGDYEYPWVPVTQVAVGISSSVTKEYEDYVRDRADKMAENERRLDAYNTLVENKPRVKARLQKAILRRRHFFTRVILNAIEPEQIKGLLDSLHVFSEGNPGLKIPLHAFAHTQPIGMSAGAFILKLKRLTPQSLLRLRQSLNLENRNYDPRLDELLGYSEHIHSLQSGDAEPKTGAEKNPVVDKNPDSDAEGASAIGKHIGKRPFSAALDAAKGSREPVLGNDSTGHVYLPTGGLFAEAVLGRSNSAEYMDIERHFDWKDSPIPHQPPAIANVSLDGRHQDSTGALNPTDLKTPLNVINAPNFPDPTGMKDVLTAIQNGEMFRDMSKTKELAGILQNLMSLTDSMGKTASSMTGDAAKDAMASAVKMGEMASQMTGKMFEQTMSQAGTAFKNMLEKGAAISGVKNNLPEGEDQEKAIKDILGIPDDTEIDTSVVETENQEDASGGDGTTNLGEDASNVNLLTTELDSLPEPGKVTKVKPQDSEASKVFNEKATALLQQGEDPDQDQLIDFALEWYHNSVLPRLQQASNDDRFFVPAFNEWVQWLGRSSSLGLASVNSGSGEMENAENEAMIWVEGGFRNAVYQAQQRAIDTNKIEYLQDAIDWSSFAMVYGFATDANRLALDDVIEDFPISVHLSDIRYPPEVAVDDPTTFSATACLKIGDNAPIFTPSLFWEMSVTGGNISGFSQGNTNSGGGFSTVINRTSVTDFEINLEIKYMDGLLEIKSFQEPPLRPGLPA